MTKCVSATWKHINIHKTMSKSPGNDKKSNTDRDRITKGITKGVLIILLLHLLHFKTL